MPKNTLKMGSRFIFREHAGAPMDTGEVVEISPAGRLGVSTSRTRGIQWHKPSDLAALIVETLIVETLLSWGEPNAAEQAEAQPKQAEAPQQGLRSTGVKNTPPTTPGN